MEENIKTSTPMKRVEREIEDLKIKTKFFLRSKSLNHVKSKYRRFSWLDNSESRTKGVKNDFVLIFYSPENPEESIAFNFKYIGLEKDEQKIFFTHKIKENINGSEEIDIVSARFKMREFLNKIDEILDNHSTSENKKVTSLIFQKFDLLFLKNDLEIINIKKNVI